MSTNGQLVFTDVDKITFKGVGNTSNAVVDTVTGKIGVGIDSPDANLHVLGNSYVSTNLELGGTLIMGTVNVSAHHSLEAVTAEGNTTPLTIEFSNATTGIVTTGNVEVGNELTVNGNVEVGTANLFVDTTTGNVGVGTTSPQGQLHISSGTSGDCVMILQADTDNSYEGDNPRIEFWQDGSIQESAIVQSDNALNIMNSVSSDAGIVFHTGTTNGYTNAVERMRIDASGNAGIGTSAPNEKLDVYGTGMRIHDPAASPKIDLLRGGSSRNPNTDTFGASDYVDWRITSGPQLKFQQQYTGANSGQLLDVMTLEHNSGNIGIGLNNPGIITTTPNVNRTVHVVGRYVVSEPGDDEHWSISTNNHLDFKRSINGTGYINAARVNYSTGGYDDLITFTGQHRVYILKIYLLRMHIDMKV